MHALNSHLALLATLLYAGLALGVAESSAAPVDPHGTAGELPPSACPCNGLEVTAGTTTTVWSLAFRRDHCVVSGGPTDPFSIIAVDNFVPPDDGNSRLSYRFRRKCTVEADDTVNGTTSKVERSFIPGSAQDLACQAELIEVCERPVEPDDEAIISFGVEGGKPTTETLDGTSVEALDAIGLDTATLVTPALPASEDLDALHILPNGNQLFSTTTSVLLGGIIYGTGDIIEFDGSGFSLFFDGALVDAASENIDAVSMLPNGNLLLSTSLSAEIYGFAFDNGDIVEVDTVGETAGLFMGLDEAALFTGANQDVDAIHYDEETGNLLLSVLTAGSGTIGGLAYDDQAADAFELDLSSGVSGSLFLNGTELYDGSTRQLDAIAVPEPGLLLQIVCGAGLLTWLERLRRRR